MLQISHSQSVDRKARELDRNVGAAENIPSCGAYAILFRHLLRSGVSGETAADRARLQFCGQMGLP